MNLTIIIIILALIAVVVYFLMSSEPIFNQTPTGFGGLPDNYISNPLEKVPELNPLEKVNPFKDIFKNPFE